MKPYNAACLTGLVSVISFICLFIHLLLLSRQHPVLVGSGKKITKYIVTMIIHAYII